MGRTLGPVRVFHTFISSIAEMCCNITVMGADVCSRCSKDLNRWDYLLEYTNIKRNANPHLILESAWRVPNWGLMKEALGQVGETIFIFSIHPCNLM